MFQYDHSSFSELAEDALRIAKKLGASDCAVDLSESTGLTVNVRMRRLETVEQTRDKSLGVTVYIGQRKGHASTGDFAQVAIEQTVKAAFDIARYTGEDESAGLPDVETLAQAADMKDLDLFHPWSLSVERAKRLAIRCEAAALDFDSAIQNSDGASVSTGSGHFLSRNSRGFSGGYAHSRHSMGVAPIAKDRSNLEGGMQRDAWYVTRRCSADLASPESVGIYAAKRTLARLGARAVPTQRVPVLFEAPLACGLLGNFAQAISGGALYREASFLVNSLGMQVFPKHISIEDDPTRPREFGSSCFDDEGVRTQRRVLVNKGVVEGYLLSSYTARKLGMQTTGNAGGSHAMRVRSSKTRAEHNLDMMIKKLHRGLLLTDVLGNDINYVTGDYSRGASGYWVEHGEIQFPVEEITIAGNLRDMFAAMVAVGADELQRGTKRSGSILIESMQIGGQ
ncbi:MAG: metalloprotease PmbA [Betaproteobacteria bacterium]|jgi:PmbA protein|nr:metalloprotease PmbA [Pseudomonadota bacterium]NBO04909.1 metalloprotease PmbA [Betaproteobacteria bacterium]NBO96634.1 metalloprotease PmbA [Betaproteobacteria bacterium]NBP33991.1 metalloprotease PmbA [Betaproteobacteria bacterium]NBP36964.1 metalloprotease PmbA [Betaproteobacteria bacterium]